MKKESYVGYKYLIAFFALVFIVIIGAVIYRVFAEITQSTFRNNSFSILYVAKDSKLIYVDKNAKSALFLAIGDVREDVKGKDQLAASISLGLPVNALIIDESPPANISEFISSKNEMRLLFDGSPQFKNMNRFDVYKFVGALRSSIEDNRVEKRINLASKKDVDGIEAHFVDSAVINMPYTIQIDNGTSINGLGSTLAKILTREGYNVIAVRTAKRALTSYVAVNESRNTYVDSLLRLTGFDHRKEKVSQAADVTIFLGDDLEAVLMP